MFPLNLLLSKNTAAIAIIGVVLFGAYTLVQSWHYEPIDALNQTISNKDKTIASKNETIKAYDREYNKLYSKLNICEQNTTKEKLEGIYNGLAKDIDQNITIDFSNAYN